VVVSKSNAESGSSEEEQTENRKTQDEGDLEDSEGEEENRAPELKKLPVSGVIVFKMNVEL
jgi:hypothetical protein